MSDTAPYTWTLDIETVAEQVSLTVVDRMGGVEVTAEQAQSVAAYIGVAVDPGSAGVARGEQPFTDVGCADCHPPPTYTDGGFHALLSDEPINTPSLLGIHASPPYFHDGRRSTLGSVINEPAMSGAHALAQQDRNDLEAFLDSL